MHQEDLVDCWQGKKSSTAEPLLDRSDHCTRMDEDVEPFLPLSLLLAFVVLLATARAGSLWQAGYSG